jgi:hypothetical protein
VFQKSIGHFFSLFFFFSMRSFFALLVVAVIALCSASRMNAQTYTEQGRWMAGGSVGGRAYTDDNVSSFSVGIAPQAGYFIAPDLVLGLGVGFGYLGNRQTGLIFSFPSSETGTWTNNVGSIRLTPFVRYYFLSLAPTTKLFAQANIGAGVSFLDQRQETSTSRTINTSTNINIQPMLTIGCAFFVTPNVSIEPSISYERTFVWSGGSTDVSGRSPVRLDITPATRSTGSLQYGVGFQVYF